MASKCNFFVIKLKRNILPMLFIMFTISLILFSNSNLSAVRSGLSLWATSVIPSLFPFFVATELLLHTNVVTKIGLILNGFMQKAFNIRGEGGFAFIMGIISGYPVGAKIACDFRKNDVCTKSECEHLLAFTNNSSPLFIIGTVGISMFGNTSIGVLLFATHVLACLTVGFLFKFLFNRIRNQSQKTVLNNSSNYNNRKTTIVSFSNLGEVLADSIKSATSTILMIGGFIVIFSCIISIIKASGLMGLMVSSISPIFNAVHIDPNFIQGMINGFLEITNGISQIASVSTKKISVSIILAAFYLGFGGLSVLLQVLSITSKSDLSIKPYIFGKLLHGLFAAFYTYLLLFSFPFFNLDL